MARIIAEINNRVPDAQGCKLLLNDDYKLYLYDGKSYREVSDENLLNLDSKGCLNWISSEVQSKVVENSEQSVWEKNRQQTVIIQKTDQVYNPEENIRAAKTRRRNIAIFLSIFNVLMILGIVAVFFFKPVPKEITKSKVDLYSMLLQANVGTQAVPVDSQEGLFIASSNSTLQSAAGSGKSYSYIENVLLNTKGTNFPLFLGPLRFSTSGSFAQMAPVIVNNETNQPTHILFVDNRINNSINRPFYTSLEDYNTVPLFLGDDGNNAFSSPEEKIPESVESYNAFGKGAFLSMVTDKGTVVQKSRLVFFNLDTANQESGIETEISSKINVQGNVIKEIKDIKVNQNWLIYKKVERNASGTDTDAGNVMISGYYIGSNGNISYTAPQNIVEKLPSQYKTYNFDIVDLNNNYVLLKGPTNALYMVDLSSIKDKNNTTEETATPTPTDKKSTKKTSLAPIEQTFKIQEVVKSTNAGSNAIIFKTYNGKTYIVYSADNKLLATDISSGDTVEILRKNKTAKIYRIMGLKSRIYWLEEEAAHAKTYDLYEAVIPPSDKR